MTAQPHPRDPAAEAALDVARRLVAAGVPVFRAMPALVRDATGERVWNPTGGTGSCGYYLPAGWQRTVPDVRVVDYWQPGDALGLVGGHGVDLVDLDTRSGGSLEALVERIGHGLPVLGRAATPSGGWHLWVPSLGVGSRDNVLPGIDVKAGAPDGQGRGFGFLPPTLKVSKVDGSVQPYAWREPLDLTRLGETSPAHEALRDLVLEARSSSGSGRTGRRVADAEVDSWLQGPGAGEPCKAMREVLERRSAALRSTDSGRHGEALSATWEVVNAAHEGHRGAAAVLEVLHRDYADACARGDRRGERPGEWVEKVAGAIGGAGPLAPDDPCGYPGGVPGIAPRARLVEGPYPAAPPAAVSPDDEARFWQARPALAHLHAFARARVVAPWALLECVLARAVAHVEPWWVLPPIIGAKASLNLFVALVAGSGGGKSTAEAAAGEAVAWPTDDPLEVLNLGSGEGLAAAYVRLVGGTKGEPARLEQHRRAVLFRASEGDTVAAVAARSGSTLLPKLRDAWMGDALGFANASQDRRLSVRAHAYRMALVMGVQPTRAGWLLDDADGGTPQRFLWALARDAGGAASWDEVPADPGPLQWSPPMPQPGRLNSTMSVPLEVVAVIRQAALDRNRLGDVPADLDGHALLARLKAAAAFAILDGRLDVDLDDWALAGVLMAHSTATRETVLTALRAAARVEGERKAEARARLELHADDVKSRAVRASTTAKVLDLLQAGPMGHAGLCRRLSKAQREHLDDVLDLLADSGQVLVEPAERQAGGAKRYRLAGGSS